MSAVHVIHENHEWSEPLFRELQAQGVPYADWHMGEGMLDLESAPPPGVFYNRMSASSHTRGHRYSPEYTAAVLAWLERHGARVINPGEALRLELSKVAQAQALAAHGIRSPRTRAALGRDAVLAAARGFAGRFITKHNRAGKGLGVKLFHDVDALQAYLDGPDFQPSVDGITLIQQYIEAPTPHITRVEFIGGELLYAVRVDTSQGFELCPADACAVDDAFCPVGEQAGEKFHVLHGFEHPLVARYRRLLAQHGVGVAAFEFIVDGDGRDYTYDINTNTNYNAQAEARAGVSGMRRLAEFLARELHALARGGRAAA
jgi:hypothetical protein